jgi:hypothetical protein
MALFFDEVLNILIRQNLSKSLHDYFKGNWCFTRTVHNFPCASAGFTMEGQAQFRDLDAHTRLYQEEGNYTLHDHPITFSQRYLFTFPSSAEQPFQCRVLFPDGRLFYELTAARQALSHTCNKDLYQGYFAIIDAQQWYCQWHISGPRKHHIMLRTTYQLREK